jgi:hypothetical protein
MENFLIDTGTTTLQELCSMDFIIKAVFAVKIQQYLVV